MTANYILSPWCCVGLVVPWSLIHQHTGAAVWALGLHMACTPSNPPPSQLFFLLLIIVVPHLHLVIILLLLVDVDHHGAGNHLAVVELFPLPSLYFCNSASMSW